MKRLKVEYYKNKCIGQGNCEAIAPNHFKLWEKKAILKKSKKIGKDTYTIEIEGDENTEKSLIDAAYSCPVNVIHIVKKETGEKLI